VVVQTQFQGLEVVVLELLVKVLLAELEVVAEVGLLVVAAALEPLVQITQALQLAVLEGWVLPRLLQVLPCFMRAVVAVAVEMAAVQLEVLVEMAVAAQELLVPLDQLEMEQQTEAAVVAVQGIITVVMEVLA
jgi:hypothetical protein